MKKIILTLTTVLLAFQLFGTPTTAYTLTSREDIGLDENLSDQSLQQYAFPKKIIITQVESEAELVDSDSEKWLSMLYYYFITRLKFADIPYNYLVDRSGTVFTGRSGWEGVVPELSEPDGVILLGYMSNSPDIPVPAGQSLKELVQQLSYKYGIKQDQVQLVNLKLVKPENENSFAKLTYSSSTDLDFKAELDTLMKSVKYSDVDHLDFKASVSDVQVGTEVAAGEKLNVKLKLKNESSFPWFTMNDFIYLMTESGADSKFAVNGVWDSFDTPLHIENKNVLPGESIDITFDLQANLLAGEHTERFHFVRLGEKALANTAFEVKFSILKGDLALVEVLPTETGALNVRETPSLGGRQVGQVNVGGVYVMLEKQSGWYKIRFEEGKEGWVSGKYIKEL